MYVCMYVRALVECIYSVLCGVPVGSLCNAETIICNSVKQRSMIGG